MFPQKSFIKSTSRREFLDLGSDGSDLFNKIMKISKNNKQVSQRKNNMGDHRETGSRKQNLVIGLHSSEFSREKGINKILTNIQRYFKKLPHNHESSLRLNCR